MLPSGRQAEKLLLRREHNKIPLRQRMIQEGRDVSIYEMSLFFV